MLPLTLGESAMPSVTDNGRGRVGDGSSMRFSATKPLVNIAQFEVRRREHLPQLLQTFGWR